MISGAASGDADFSGKHGFLQQRGDRTESLTLHYVGNTFTTQAAQTGIIPKTQSNWHSELRLRVPAYQPCEVHGLRIICSSSSVVSRRLSCIGEECNIHAQESEHGWAIIVLFFHCQCVVHGVFMFL